MKEVVRRSIAYAAALQIADRRPSVVSSRRGHDRSPMSETYDQRTGCNLSALRTSRFLVHDPSTCVIFHRSGKQFSGWVEASGSRYCGTVSGDVVTIYDQQVGLHFQYQLT